MVGMRTTRSDRARRLAQVKFLALPHPDEAGLQETAFVPAHSSPRGWVARFLAIFRIRVSIRLAAARP